MDRRNRNFWPLRAALWLPLVALAGLCLVFFQSLEFSPRNVLPSALIDKPMPAFSLPDLFSDSLVTSAELPAEAFLVNVWATWCFPCREEHPILMDIAATGVPIVGLNYQDEDQKARNWLQSIGDPYLLNLVDRDGDYGVELGVYGVPATYFVDGTGLIRYKHIGPISASQWQNELSEIFASLQGPRDSV